MMRPKRQLPARGGFTMIELLVVIAIIGVLTGLLVMTISHMSRSGKVNATRADLQNVKAMLDELSAGGGFTHPPPQWLWRALANGTIVVDNSRTVDPQYGNWDLDFWRIPMRTGQMDQIKPNPSSRLQYIDALDAQVGALTPDNPVIRNASRVVLNTQLAMQILLAFHTNREALNKLPADRLFIPDWESGKVPNMATGQDGVFGNGGSDSITDVTYCVNNCVRYNGVTYRCIKANVAGSAGPPPNNSWVQDNHPTPLVLDAWGNPIIFVPASGLINVFTGSAGGGDSAVTALPSVYTSNPPNAKRPLPPITSPEGQNDARYNLATFSFNHTDEPGDYPPGRPFFVSGGPDGDISTGEDNVYSFEK